MQFPALFRPKEVRDVLFALDWLRGSTLAQNMCFDEIERMARSTVIGNYSLIRERLLIDRQEALHVALNLIVNLCGRDIASGKDHTYRAVLGLRGSAKKALFISAQKMMLDKNYIDEEDVAQGTALLARQIAEAG